MFNNSTNINNDHLSPYIIEHNEDHEICWWKCSPDMDRHKNMAC